MHTRDRFCDLTKKSELSYLKSIEPDDFSVKPSVAQRARILALAECLGARQEQVAQELLDCALSYAHNEFLLAFSDTVQKNKKNLDLKQRVMMLKQSLTYSGKN